MMPAMTPPCPLGIPCLRMCPLAPLSPPHAQSKRSRFFQFFRRRRSPAGFIAGASQRKGPAGAIAGSAQKQQSERRKAIRGSAKKEHQEL